DDDVVDIVRRLAAVHKYSTETLTGDVDRTDDGIVFRNSRKFKSKSLQVDIFLGGQDAQKTVIQQIIYITSYLILNQFCNLFYSRAQTDAQHLALFADYQNIGIQRFHHYFTDIIEYHLRGMIIMK